MTLFHFKCELFEMEIVLSEALSNPAGTKALYKNT